MFKWGLNKRTFKFIYTIFIQYKNLITLTWGILKFNKIVLLV